MKRSNYVLSVGRLEKRKRHDLVIRALSHVPRASRPSLMIASTWDSPVRRSELENLASELNVGVEFRFGITDEELLCLYNSCRMVFYGAVREPFGLVAIEAMACGTPVIGVREGGLQESIRDGETGLLVRPEAEDAAQAIMRLLSDEWLYEKISDRGPAYIENFWSWEISVDRFERHLEEALPSESKNMPGRDSLIEERVVSEDDMPGTT